MYCNLGQKELAREYYEQALKISREVGDRRGEGRILNNTTMLYDNPLQRKQVQEQLKQALEISREVGDRKGEAWTLHNLGRICQAQGKGEEAWNYFEQAWSLRREIGDRRGEGWTLHNIGILSLEQSRYEEALALLLLAKRIFEEMQSPDSQKAQESIDTLQMKVGRDKFVDLLQRVKPQAPQIVEQILREKRNTLKGLKAI